MKFRALFPLIPILLIAAMIPAFVTGTALARFGPRVAAYLTEHPGGLPLSANEISYGNGALIITLVRPDLLASPDCPAGWFCFYEGTSYTYPRGKLSDCGWQDLATFSWQNRTESVHYNLLNGSVDFIQHVDASHSSDTVLFNVGVLNPTDPDVSPYRNMADHVYRYC